MNIFQTLKVSRSIPRILPLTTNAKRNESTTTSNKYKLKEKDYERYLNFVSSRREPSLIRKMTDCMTTATANTISFAGGFPNSDLFPFEEAAFKLKSGKNLVLDEGAMRHAQQYGPTTGYPPLLKKVQDFVFHYHNPPNWSESKVAIIAGSQDGFSRALEMVLSPGDYVIVENPSFCGALNVIKPHMVNLLGIESDAHGMKPEELRKQLSKWTPEEVKNAKHGVPKVIYTNPTSTNPSGVSLTTERKEEIYEIARHYNLLILEDDPYYFIQFGNPKNSPKSFLSMDTDGRVLRMDSFSKVICGGFRIGYLTGPAKLVTKYVQHSEVTILHASSISQVIIDELLNQWGSKGLESHIQDVRSFYLSQLEAMERAAKKHLSSLCQWNRPTGGMFLWLKVFDLNDTTEMVLQRALSKELLLMPGNDFMVDDKKPCPYLRLSYSHASPQQMDEGCGRLAELINEEIELMQKRNKNISSINL